MWRTWKKTRSQKAENLEIRTRSSSECVLPLVIAGIRASGLRISAIGIRPFNLSQSNKPVPFDAALPLTRPLRVRDSRDFRILSIAMEKARTVLAERGLLGKSTVDQVELDPAKVWGLRIILK